MWVLCSCDALEWLANRDDISLIPVLIRRVQADPRSLVRARELGGDEWFGWDRAHSMLADLYDASIFGTHAAAVNAKAKYRPIAPRPAIERDAIEQSLGVSSGNRVMNTVHKASSVMDLNWGKALDAGGVHPGS